MFDCDVTGGPCEGAVCKCDHDLKCAFYCISKQKLWHIFLRNRKNVLRLDLHSSFHSLSGYRFIRLWSIYEYFHKNNLFFDSQYGFLKNHSTEYAAMEFTDKVFKDIEEQNISLTIFMDSSKAFDTLDHNILIKKLAHYGINGTPLEWFTSYLTGRSQFVEIDDVSCNVLSLSTGVPQASILGPLLFLIYMNDIPYCTKYFNFILYADDTTLSNTIQIPPMYPLNINDELAKVYDWLAVNKLSLNVKKSTWYSMPSTKKLRMWFPTWRLMVYH